MKNLFLGLLMVAAISCGSDDDKKMVAATITPEHRAEKQLNSLLLLKAKM